MFSVPNHEKGDRETNELWQSSALEDMEREKVLFWFKSNMKKQLTEKPTLFKTTVMMQKKFDVTSWMPAELERMKTKSINTVVKT